MRNLESTIQCNFMQWLKLQCPAVHAVSFAIVNGGARTKSYGSRLKREGMKAGVPDVFIAYPTYKHPGMWIEFKSAKGRVSPEQKRMMGLLTERGYRVEVCYNFDQAMEAVNSYLGRL